MTALTGRAPHPCPLCSGSKDDELHRHRGRIVRCLSCGLVRQDPIPSLDELSDIYRADDYFRLQRPAGIGYRDYFRDEGMYRPYFRRKIAVLARYARPPGRLLEVGAAAGYALDEAARAGWEVEGLELSTSAVAYGRARFGVNARVGSITDLPEDGSRDVVVAFQVIEHLPRVRDGIDAVVRSVRPGGIVMLTTPDHSSLVRRSLRGLWPAYRPEHLLYFDPTTIRTLLERSGLEVLRIRADDPLRVPIGRLLERAAHYYLRRTVPMLPGPSVPVIMGDMEIIARRSA